MVKRGLVHRENLSRPENRGEGRTTVLPTASALIMQPRNQLTTANRLGRTGLVLILAWCATAFPSAALALKSAITHIATDIAVGDFNNDGIDDLVTCGNSDSSSSVDVLLGKGNGTFHRPKESSVGSGPGAIALSDSMSMGSSMSRPRILGLMVFSTIPSACSSVPATQRLVTGRIMSLARLTRLPWPT